MRCNFTSFLCPQTNQLILSPLPPSLPPRQTTSTSSLSVPQQNQLILSPLTLRADPCTSSLSFHQQNQLMLSLHFHPHSLPPRQTPHSMIENVISHVAGNNIYNSVQILCHYSFEVSGLRTKLNFICCG